MPTATIPPFYNFFFKYVDPLIALGGAYLNFFDPISAVTGMAPNSKYDPDQVFLFHQSGGLALAVAFISAVLPRHTTNVTTWRIIQFALFLSDLAGLSGIGCALWRQGRFAPANWTSDDIGCGGGYVFLTLVRLHFLLYTSGGVQEDVKQN
ncbi:hypothetical protein NCS57_00503900 [Fusarium keratoplasticum]|uniref:Uncharacterized protein n=1 Tax=Fusarium keratoplasticum TaxID=1328300 RepID=A0ACC0R8K1_9HYPO|nr:hypothetical protein NCS57_00503900 [Fusarium keratoplasticum]KAI8664626.1 hypothetical protein NCS55_00972100 [Fusarium keratoplasticum]KAI8676009.1 hypothetical protein NCS57_00503900 [Fusarium keratoplasticum]